MNKTYRAVICSILLVTLLFGLGALAYAPKSDSNVQGIKEVKLSCQPKEIYIKQGACTPKWSKCTLKIVGADVPALDMELLIDRSKKAWQEIEPKKEEINNFIDKFKNEGIPVRVSLVSLAPQENVVPATDGLEKIKKAIDAMTGSEELPDLGEGINLAIEKLKNERPKAVKVMVVITAYQGKIARVMIPTWEAEEEDIYVFTVGTNYPNYAALRWIAQKTKAQFFKKPSKENLDSLFQEIEGELKGEVAQDIDIKVTFSDHANIKAVQNDCQIGDTGINCEKDKLSNDEEWEIKFTVGSHEKKPIDVQSLKITATYPDGKPKTTEKGPIPNVILVPNHPPEAKFEVRKVEEEDPDQFTTADRGEFVDKSEDCDGEIKKREWTIDGKPINREPQFTYQFEQPNDYEVCLAVTDDNGGHTPPKTDKECKQIQVKPVMSAQREIRYFLPPKFPPQVDMGKILANEDYNEFYPVNVEITTNTELYGVKLIETLPQGWEAKPVSPECKKAENTPGEDNKNKIICRVKKLKKVSKKNLAYQIKPTQDLTTCTVEKISGVVSTLDPFIQPGKDVEGDKEMNIINYLPIERAVSCWNVGRAQLDPGKCRENQISEGQKEQALAWWEKQEPVPGTDGKKITDEKMTHIIECKKQKVSVTECIQEPIKCPEETAETAKPQAGAQAICINQASSADLEKIAGIGSKTAASISGILPIHNWEDLLKVKGIGEKTLELIKKQFNLC